MKKAAYVVTLAVLFSFSIFAQAVGSLSGTVVDPSGAAIPGAKVQLLLAGGKSAVASTQTGPAGEFHFSSLAALAYDIHVETTGFAAATIANLHVDPARDTTLPTIRLELSSTSVAVEVKEAVQAVETTNAEVTTTVTTAQIDNLPVLDRQVTNLFTTQAGVSVGKTATNINGLPPSVTNLTLDGVNIQDNFIRSNDLDYLPNKLTIDQISEISINTSNANPALGLGASQISLVTKSGTNEFHGDVYWYNRNSALSANDWFNNQTGSAKPFLNLNQLGGSIGGPIIKDKLFFYLNYEAFRLRQQSLTINQVLTPSARQGILTYPGASGATQTFNILTAQHLSIDPTMQAILNQVPTTINSNLTGDGLNTGGYAFNAAANEDRDNATGRIDYYLSQKHILAGSYIFNRDDVDRPTIGSFYTTIPPVTNANHSKFLSASWRWTPTPTLTNELRGGFNIAPGSFDAKLPPYVIDNGPFSLTGLDPLIFSSPVNTFQPQGRATNTYSLQDNATWTRGRHVISFGYQSQWIGITPYDYNGVIPIYGVGESSNSPYGFAPGSIPGANATFTNTANDLLAALAGLVTQDQQIFNVTSRTSGYVSAAPNKRHFTFNTYSGYVADSWKALRRLTVSLGLRYDYYTVLHETDSLDLLPELINNNPILTVLSNATTTFAGGPVGPQFYKPDHHNFAPNAGFAWDVFGNGKTALRGGYSMAYVNDDAIATLVNNIDTTNGGLSATIVNNNLTNIVNQGLPSITAPTFQVPRTFADNYAINPGNAQGMPNPNLVSPYVQQWSFGVQHELKGGFIVEGRYVGNHAVKGLRAIDYNQINIYAAGFLQDFIRARNNGFLSAAAGQGFNPAYTGPGTQPLTVFPQLPFGGLLNVPVIDHYIQTGEAGELAAIYQQNGLNGNINFFPNPYTNGANVVTNYSSSTYNGLQLDVRKRTASGVQFQFNYTFSKALGDSEGTGAERFQPFLDLNNGHIEKGPLPFDLRNVFHGNFFYPIPMDNGHRFAYAPLNRFMSGWGVSSIITYESGSNFSILSALATVNRAGINRSGLNTANSLLSKSQLNNDVGFFMTGNGPMFVNPAVINSGGFGVSPPGEAPFTGQIFFNPDPGTLGTLQRNMFNGPWDFNCDFSIHKNTKITERQSIEFRADFYNIFNHPAFTPGDEFDTQNYGPATLNSFNVNQPNFGKIATEFNASRVIQFGLYYRF
ncbi:MAG TPA: TonB-dependent receptor [Bryobacteraceae bacterium]|nr:TonB-dependent receptor [Bryobacteraceae bacterium]